MPTSVSSTSTRRTAPRSTWRRTASPLACWSPTRCACPPIAASTARATRKGRSQPSWRPIARAPAGCAAAPSTAAASTCSRRRCRTAAMSSARSRPPRWSPRAPSPKPPSRGSTPRLPRFAPALPRSTRTAGCCSPTAASPNSSDSPPIGHPAASRSPRCWTFWRRVRNLPASTAPHSSPLSATLTVHNPRRHAASAPAAR